MAKLREIIFFILMVGLILSAVYTFIVVSTIILAVIFIAIPAAALLLISKTVMWLWLLI